jgi:hypothetical protein
MIEERQILKIAALQRMAGFDPELPCPRAPAAGSPRGERGSYGHSMHVSGEVSIGR